MMLWWQLLFIGIYEIIDPISIRWGLLCMQNNDIREIADFNVTGLQKQMYFSCYNCYFFNLNNLQPFTLR